VITRGSVAIFAWVPANGCGAVSPSAAYAAGMTFPFHIDVAQYSKKARWFMAVAWIVIAAKCVVVAWAMEHWRVPFNSAWIIAPTLVFAALASVLWLTHPRE
jgi:hypothetical protein